MRYQQLFLAHGAFKTYEKRSEYYDTYLKNKDGSKWTQPDLPRKEIDQLFDFIIHWDFHFQGDKDLFSQKFKEIFSDFIYLQGKDFYSLDLNEENSNCIRKVFNTFALCNYAGRHESTDASKIAHVTNPSLFVMWDRKIRKGLLGRENNQYAKNYVNDFLPLMKQELSELLRDCRRNSSLNDLEIISSIETICNGYTITKLLDEHNYMNYTMPTEYRLYIDKTQDNTPEEILFRTFEESKDFWKNLFAKWNRDIVKEFNELLNELIKPKLITPKERREHFSRFRDVPKDRDYLMSFLQEMLDRHKMNKSESN